MVNTCSAAGPAEKNNKEHICLQWDCNVWNMRLGMDTAIGHREIIIIVNM